MSTVTPLASSAADFSLSVFASIAPSSAVSFFLIASCSRRAARAFLSSSRLAAFSSLVSALALFCALAAAWSASAFFLSSSAFFSSASC